MALINSSYRPPGLRNRSTCRCTSAASTVEGGAALGTGWVAICAGDDSSAGIELAADPDDAGAPVHPPASTSTRQVERHRPAWLVTPDRARNDRVIGCSSRVITVDAGLGRVKGSSSTVWSKSPNNDV